MILIGMLDSPFVRRVAVALQLYGLPYEHRCISVFRHQDEMRALNPLLKVPALLLDDGTRLVESSLVLDYLDAQVPAERRLLPPAGARRWRLLQTLGAALMAMEKAVQLYYEYNQRPDTARSPDWAARCRAQLTEALRQLDADDALDGIAGRGPTHADIAAAVCVGFLRHIDPSLPEPVLAQGAYPRLIGLAAHCETLPAFIATAFDAHGYPKR